MSKSEADSLSISKSSRSIPPQGDKETEQWPMGLASLRASPARWKSPD
jgi:hypothetical protein